jgi:two-component system cell cycle sensor histidine kinase/response regulator CckA
MNSKAILVIDDEEPVRLAAADILEMVGLTVLLAEDGEHGLAIYRERQADIGLVLLDLTMPGLNGEETFHRLRDLNPQVHVLFSSGYTQRDVMSRFAGQDLVWFIQKPYDADALVKTVQQHLG